MYHLFLWKLSYWPWNEAFLKIWHKNHKVDLIAKSLLVFTKKSTLYFFKKCNTDLEMKLCIRTDTKAKDLTSKRNCFVFLQRNVAPFSLKNVIQTLKWSFLKIWHKNQKVDLVAKWICVYRKKYTLYICETCHTDREMKLFKGVDIKTKKLTCFPNRFVFLQKYVLSIFLENVIPTSNRSFLEGVTQKPKSWPGSEITLCFYKEMYPLYF